MENRIERLSFAGGSPRRIAAGLALGLVAIALVVWHFAKPAGSGGVVPGAEQTMVIAPRPFSVSVSLVGTVQPGDGLAVFAPFDGTVRSIGFAYGDRVNAGQILATLNTAEIADRRSAADTDFLKSQQAMTELAGWAASPDVSRARRARTSASMELGNTDREIAETRALLDKGLVPRAEYDGLVQQRQGQSLALSAAGEDYDATMRRGQGVNARVAALELERNRNRLADLDAQMLGASIRAPSDGIVVRPARESSEAPDELHVGMHLSKGQLIGSIARAGALSVAFKLDEADVNQIRIGQKVSVTGPGFGGAILPGEVIRVGGEAASGTPAAATKASFTAIARLDAPPPDAAAAIRIGMTATIAVETYGARAAIVIPPAAVLGAAPTATVMVIAGDSRVPRAIQVGHVAPDGVEILSGLKPGDRIVWTESPPASEE